MESPGGLTRASSSTSGGSRPRVERPVSAGGVVFQRNGDSMAVVLCGRIRPRQWCLPKGTPEPGESLEATALREVREETGLEVRIVADLGHIEYWFSQDGVRYHKRVYYYLMEPIGGDTNLHDPEFDEVHWFPLDQTTDVMTHETEAEVVARARRAVLEGDGYGHPH